MSFGIPVLGSLQGHLTPKVCDTCVEMTLLNQEMSQELIRLRKTDAILRKVNSTLRSTVTKLRTDLDELFLSICEPDEEEVLDPVGSMLISD